MNDKQKDVKGKLIDDIMSITIFNNFFKNISDNMEDYNINFFVLSIFYVASFSLGVYLYEIKCCSFWVFLMVCVVIFLLYKLYKITEKVYKHQLELNHYENLKKILKAEEINSSESVSNLIDEAIYFKDSTKGLKDTLKETMIQSIKVILSLFNIVLSIFLGKNLNDNPVSNILILLFLYLSSIPFVYFYVESNKKSFNNLSTKDSCYYLYLAYLYKYKTELSIDEFKLDRSNVDNSNADYQHNDIIRVEDPKATTSQRNRIESLILILAGAALMARAFVDYKKFTDE